MPFEARWWVENRLVWGRFWGEISLEVVNAASSQLFEMSNRSPYIVYLVVDVRDVKSIPSLSSLTRLEHYKASNQVWTVLVVTNRTFAFIASVALQYTGNRLRLVNDEAGALAFIHEQEPNTPELLDIPPIPEPPAS